MIVADTLRLAFGAVSGMTLVAMLLFARENVRDRGVPRGLASLAASILALLLLLVAGAQLQAALLALKIDPATHAPAPPALDPKSLVPAFLAFVSSPFFLGAFVSAMAAAAIARITRDDSSEESEEAEPLDESAPEPAV